MQGRQFYILGFALSIGAIFIAVGLEKIWQLEPCPLCILSRLVVMACSFLFIAAFFFYQQKSARITLRVLGVVACLTGIGISARHLWIQNLPPEQVPACGPSLDYLMQALPLQEVLAQILSGSGECAKTQWTLLSLSLPAWTLVLFVLLLASWLMPIKKG